MKNKLLLSSALISGLAFAGSALAETKITGNIDISLGSRSSDSSLNSSSGFGSETQINLSNSGTLNNGMGYAAGFSIESDNDNDAFENAYINFMPQKGTMLHFGSDHFPGIDGTVTPKVAVAADTMTGGSSTEGNNGADRLYSDGTVLDGVEAQGVGILQDVGSAGKIGIHYAPNEVKGQGAGNDTFNFNETGNSILGLSFRGNLGVDGLSVLIGREKQDKTSGELSDTQSTNIGASYNFGIVAIGASHIKHEFGTKTRADAEIKSKEVGITFAASDNLSLGVSYHESEDNAAGTKDEEITMVQAGYNLGGVSISLNYAEMQNTGGGTNDDEFVLLRMGAKF